MTDRPRTAVSGTASARRDRPAAEVDVLGVGAGLAGLYLLHRLRGLGFSAVLVDEAADVGGTWYWNRYPGARCDVATTDYCYGFDPELESDWTWSEKYATQAEILAYLAHVTERFDLRRDIVFSTRVEHAAWDARSSRWVVRTDRGDMVSCKFLVMATGCLSRPKALDIPAVERFGGDVLFTSRWPHGGVDLSGRRVGVVGTGSSGVQAIPVIARQAASLTVFQRTPAYALPAHHGPPLAERVAALSTDRRAYRDAARRSWAGVPVADDRVSARAVSDEERRRHFDAAWEEGELFSLGARFSDILTDRESNELVAELIRERIRATVADPETAEALCPRGVPYGAKRPCLDDGYYETFNLPHVRLVDLRADPITTVTESGIATEHEAFPLDAIVFATGFDAVTGALVAVDIEGRGGVRLARKWAGGPSTYLGLMTAGFPNMFTITGPGSPSVLSNMAVSIEQHVEWVADCLVHLRGHGFEAIEPTPAAEEGWVQHVADWAALTLYPYADSWYMGANVPGKPVVFLPYVGGVDSYRRVCEDVVARTYLGFTMEGPAGGRRNDGVVRRLQPDVAMVLDAIEAMQLPRLEDLGVDGARQAMEAASQVRPPGPDVGEVVDGTLPGPDGDLRYRSYRPAGSDPVPALVYFHGGGFVLGDQASDDPLCRDLCVRTGALVVSADYRHAPEARFPAAVEDAMAAVRWVSEHLEELGAAPGPVAVGGWSAGANLAAVVCQLALGAGGPPIAAQMLLMPVTDEGARWPSRAENANGFGLTAALLDWFADLYADPVHRGDPRVSPLGQPDLHGLPPAAVLTAQFDPLRDEGGAYADALRAAGVPVRHVRARGHTHVSPTMVDLVLSGAPVRAEVAAALREWLDVVAAG